MKSYLKFLSRNKLYTAIEAVGLIVSLAFLLIIGTSLYDQYQVTNGIAGSDNLYYIATPGATGMEYKSRLQLDSYPEIVNAAALFQTEVSLVSDMGRRRIKLMTADPELLEMIPLRVNEGSLEVFRRGSGIVISASAANRLFPGKDLIGKAVSLGGVGYAQDMDELPVVAVVEDPTFTILSDFDILCPMEAPYQVAKDVRESDLANRGIGWLVGVMARMLPGTDTNEFAQKFCSDLGFKFKEGEVVYPLRSLYFSSLNLFGIRQGKRLYPQVLLLLGILLLLSATLIYITLGTAVSGNRAKEMATRRLIGASRREVFLRTITGPVLFTLVCFGLAVLLAITIVPSLNSIRPVGLTVPFRVSGSPAIICLSLLLVLLIGIMGGLAPAKLLSSYRPIDVVTGQVRRQRKMGFNKVCIIALSFLALILVCLSITLEAQLRHLETLDQGTDPIPDLFYFHPHRFSGELIHALGDRLAQEPGVHAIAYSDAIPSHIRGLAMCPDRQSITYIACDTVAFRLLGFRVKETYEEMIPGSVWIPETAQNAFGISAESAELSKVFSSTDMNSICGVIEDVRRITENGFDPWEVLIKDGHNCLPPAVCIYPSAYAPYLTGILIQTSDDHTAFKERFIKLARDFFLEHTDRDMPEFVNDRYSQCGYLEDIAAADYEELRRYVRVVEVFTLIALLLAMLGLLAICTWYASVNAKDIAIRKVFGGTVEGEAARSILRYLSYVLVAVAVGIPVAILLTGRLLERWPDRISGYWWIFVVSALFVLLISTVSIFWQTLKAAKTNPAIELKKE